MTTTFRWLCELLPSSFAVDKRSSSDGFNENNDDDADDSVGYVASWMRMHTMWLRRVRYGSLSSAPATPNFAAKEMRKERILLVPIGLTSEIS